MRAVVCARLGPPEVLELREVAVPRPGKREVLVRVRAASVNALDWRRFERWMDRGQVSLGDRLLDAVVLRSAGKVFGADIAGVVEAVGAGVEGLRVRDEVFGVTSGSKGAFPELALAAADHLVVKPPRVSFEAAAAVPVAALTALRGLRDEGRVRAGESVLIHGASGGVGTFAVQIARALGARVTAVASADKAGLALSLGAVRAIDYAREDFSRDAARYDVILAVNGRRSLLDYRRALLPGGRCVIVGGSMGQVAQGALLGPVLSLLGGRKLGFAGITRPRQGDLAFLADLLATGGLVPSLDRRFPLAAAAEAVRYLGRGHPSGKVTLEVTEAEVPPEDPGVITSPGDPGRPPPRDHPPG